MGYEHEAELELAGKGFPLRAVDLRAVGNGAGTAARDAVDGFRRLLLRRRSASPVPPNTQASRMAWVFFFLLR